MAINMAYRPGVKIVKRTGKSLDKFEESIQQVDIVQSLHDIGTCCVGYTRAGGFFRY
jgi:hypothetical protein